MFRRRHPLPFLQRLRGWLWPQTGWRRLGTYLVKRLTRLPGTPHNIAAGFACGAAISFTPFMGLHAVLSVLLSFLVRGNYLAAMVGTLVGNPWTFPFIWVATAKLGQAMLGGPEPAIAALQTTELHHLIHEIGALIWPMTVGSVPLGVLAGLGTYFPLVRMVAAYQSARRHRRERRRAERRSKLGLAAPGVSPNITAS